MLVLLTNIRTAAFTNFLMSSLPFFHFPGASYSQATMLFRGQIAKKEMDIKTVILPISQYSEKFTCP